MKYGSMNYKAKIDLLKLIANNEENNKPNRSQQNRVKALPYKSRRSKKK